MTLVKSVAKIVLITHTYVFITISRLDLLVTWTVDKTDKLLLEISSCSNHRGELVNTWAPHEDAWHSPLVH